MVRTRNLDSPNEDQHERQGRDAKTLASQGVKKRRRQRRPEISSQKRQFLRDFISSYERARPASSGVETAADLQEALKDLLGDALKDMLEVEMNEHLGYEKYQRSDNSDSRNGVKQKEVRSSLGSLKIDVPQDRNSTFEPKIVKKGHYKPAARSVFKISSAGAVYGCVCRRRT